MSGYVVEKKISQGGFIRNDNGDNLFTIGDISEYGYGQMYMRAILPK